MLIGELCKRTGLSRDTIRFYEKKGLIVADKPLSDFNNYKNYTKEAFEKLGLIKRAKKFGFTLNEIAEIIELTDLNQATCDNMEQRVQKKIKEINGKIKELKEMKALILDRVEEAKKVCVPKSGNACQCQITS